MAARKETRKKEESRPGVRLTTVSGGTISLEATMTRGKRRKVEKALSLTTTGDVRLSSTEAALLIHYLEVWRQSQKIP